MRYRPQPVLKIVLVNLSIDLSLQSLLHLLLLALHSIVRLANDIRLKLNDGGSLCSFNHVRQSARRVFGSLAALDLRWCLKRGAINQACRRGLLSGSSCSGRAAAILYFDAVIRCGLMDN